MKIAIIGGGISGLYTAFRLLQHNRSNEVHIYESSDRLGGRIHTIYSAHGTQVAYEAGAGRFSKSHKRLFRLIRELGLETKVQPIHSKRIYMKNGVAVKTDIVQSLLFKKVLGQGQAFDAKYLQTITMKEYMETCLGKKKTEDVIHAFGYNSEFEVQNAYTSLKVFRKDFNDTIDYYYLQGGLSQIVSALHKRLIELGCHIHLGTTVTDYNPLDNIIEYKRRHRLHFDKVDNVVFAITKDTLSKFQTLLAIDKGLRTMVDSIASTPLCRIYAKFPKHQRHQRHDVVWFAGLPRMTMNNKLRYIIPYNEEAGIIQITYTDNDYAKYWGEMSKREVVDALLLELTAMFPDRGPIPKPTWVNIHYWKEGAHYWQPCKRSRQALGHSSSVQNYYIIGEMTSRFHTAWIEGALESTDTPLKLMNDE
jgi:protoporphyrinogen oxidase